MEFLATISGSSPRSSLERLTNRGGSSRRRCALLYGFILGAAVAGLVAAAVVMNGRTSYLLGDCAAGLADAPLPAAILSSGSKAAGFASDLASSGVNTLQEALMPSPSPLPAALLAPVLRTPSVFPRDFYFVKTKKVGGSTLKGILNGVCAHHGVTCMKMPPAADGSGSQGYWNAKQGVPHIERYHEMGFEHLAITDHGCYSEALRAELHSPLVLTAVREPVARLISQFFFQYRVGGDPEKPDLLSPTMAALAVGEALPADTVAELRDYSEIESNLIFKDIAENRDEQTVAEAAAVYDFIFVQERFDESLVAFAVQYGLSFRDIAHTSSKNQTGKYPAVSQLPEDLVAHIAAQNAKDAELYRSADEALTRRVAALRDAHVVDHVNNPDFDALLKAFEALQAAVSVECAGGGGPDEALEAAFVSWYDRHGFSDGHFYSNDGGAVGAGFRCVDFVARRFEAGAVL